MYCMAKKMSHVHSFSSSSSSSPPPYASQHAPQHAPPPHADSQASPARATDFGARLAQSVAYASAAYVAGAAQNANVTQQQLRLQHEIQKEAMMSVQERAERLDQQRQQRHLDNVNAMRKALLQWSTYRCSPFTPYWVADGLENEIALYAQQHFPGAARDLAPRVFADHHKTCGSRAQFGSVYAFLQALPPYKFA